ncbi:MAG: hypothetical protein GX801_10310 [Fibrobacter sp.]|nr:hypothetical protein [Fibrobacter sp.]
MKNHLKNNYSQALPQRTVWLILLCFLSSSASTAWFSVIGSVNAKKAEYTTVVRIDSVPVYKGSMRPAMEHIATQTFMALKFSMESWYQGPDTVFSWSYASWYKNENSKIKPIAANVVRWGQGHNEWVYWSPQKSTQVHFHSPFYGFSSHDGLDNCIPEEQLWVEAPLLLRTLDKPKFCVLPSLTEASYLRRSWQVVGSITGQKAKIDDIECELVRFNRDDGAFMEFWVSPQSLQVLKVQSFLGTQYQRFQYDDH